MDGGLSLIFDEGCVVAGIKNRLKEFREKRDLTLERAAELMGLTHSTIQRHETGNIPISVAYLERYASIYDCRPLELITDGLVVDAAEDRELIETTRQMPEKDREMVLDLVRRLKQRG